MLNPTLSAFRALPSPNTSDYGRQRAPEPVYGPQSGLNKRKMDTSSSIRRNRAVKIEMCHISILRVYACHCCSSYNFSIH